MENLNLIDIRFDDFRFWKIFQSVGEFEQKYVMEIFEIFW